MATHKRTKTKPYRRVLNFPQVKGKTIERVELDVSSDYYIMEIRFEDKTALVFDLHGYELTRVADVGPRSSSGLRSGFRRNA